VRKREGERGETEERGRKVERLRMRKRNVFAQHPKTSGKGFTCPACQSPHKK
jgi:hypothetical protein